MSYFEETKQTILLTFNKSIDVEIRLNCYIIFFFLSYHRMFLIMSSVIFYFSSSRARNEMK